MASEKGPVATEAPLAAPSAPLATALQQPPAPSSDAFAPPDAAAAGRSSSLKRPRDASPSATAGLAQPDVVPVKYARLVDSTKYSAPPPLTAQAALDDEQRRRDDEARLHPPDAVSENPAQQALAALRGAEAAMSRATEGPPPPPPVGAQQQQQQQPTTAAAAAAVADAAVKALNPVIIPSAPTGGGPAAAIAAAAPATGAGAGAGAGAAIDSNHAGGASPHSVTSGQSLGSGPQVVHSPISMDVDARGSAADRQGYLQPEAQMEEKPISMSYPGILPPGGVAGVMPAPTAPQRGMSLPMSTSQNPDLAPRSPSSKKHKCPYCETEFTRHHNLKSHLLTHSQEKPYVCQDCQMRFRRLHDLKRHSKLHTGEKPHICPKCDRKFARGDALARHSKGAGGCAGRRASMGSFGGDDDYEGASTTEADDSAMTGVVYDNPDADMTDEERRRLSLPAIKAPSVAAAQPGGAGGGGGPDAYTPLSRSYPPPVGARQGPTGALAQGSAAPTMPAIAPQPASQTASHSRTSTSSNPSHTQGGTNGDTSANMFASGEGMWAYIQNLEARLQQQDEKARQQDEQLRHQDEQLRHQVERIAALEARNGHLEIQFGHLATDLTALRGGPPAVAAAAAAAPAAQPEDPPHE